MKTKTKTKMVMENLPIQEQTLETQKDEKKLEIIIKETIDSKSKNVFQSKRKLLFLPQ